MNIKSIKKWHVFLLWPALIACCIYVVSAFTHPLMAWTGPQAKVMFAPTLTLKPNQFEHISEIIQDSHLHQVKMAKLVPFQDEVLLQITHDNLSPRRYFSTLTKQELINHDQEQAIWLAQHYLKQDLPIKNIEFINQFSQSYPAVNRLLPVYKLNFDTQDDLSVYIHTDTQALASIENNWKRSLRFVFQTFHSFNWLDNYELLRLVLISFLVSTLLIISMTGLLYLIKLRRKHSITDIRRRWHRRLGWIVVAPLFLFSLSGLYHLWQASLVSAPMGMQLTQSLDLSQWPKNKHTVLPENININQVSLIQISTEEYGDTQHLYRLSISKIQSEQDQSLNKNTRHKRFDGQAKEKSALYIDANSGELLPDLDQTLILQQAKKHLGADDTHDLPMTFITHFGLGYDFRNKRLPVWRVEGNNGVHVFIDPITHILVDQNNTSGRLEGYSFSFLHKWNMLTPILGRFNRDMLILFTLGLIFLLTALGLWMRLKTNLKH